MEEVNEGLVVEMFNSCDCGVRLCVCSAGGSDIVCLSLISLGVQTCSEDDRTTWRTQDCSPSVVKTAPDPFGWYQKPGTATL